VHQYFEGTYKYITFLRHPVDRFISHYYYSKNNKQHYLYEKINKNNLSLCDFASLDIATELDNGMCRYITGINPPLPSVNFESIYLKATEIIDNKFAFIGIVEEFDKSLLRFYKFHKTPVYFYKKQNRGN
jgi:hypothetical protein